MYQLAILGEPRPDQVAELHNFLADAVARFGLTLGADVGWHVRPADFAPAQQQAAAAVFFGGTSAQLPDGVLQRMQSLPIVPVVTATDKIADELPEALRRFHALVYSREGPARLGTALLECAGLLPRQRRVFLSYRRDEARGAALQLFDAIAARQFDVFLDTHDIAPGEDFQATLWHRLCDSDVLVMLDTPGYFSSRWTEAEYGRALAKSISVLRIGWPDVTASPRTLTASQLPLSKDEVNQETGLLSEAAIRRVCEHLEIVRSQSVAVRRLNLVSRLADELQRIGGKVDGIGVGNVVHGTLPDGRPLVVYPTVGVPTSVTLYEAVRLVDYRPAAVIYDHVGLHRSWLDHLEWLGNHISTPRCVKVAEAAWQFAAWGHDI
jgi:hypothetical protein